MDLQFKFDPDTSAAKEINLVRLLECCKKISKNPSTFSSSLEFEQFRVVTKLLNYPFASQKGSNVAY